MSFFIHAQTVQSFNMQRELKIAINGDGETFGPLSSNMLKITWLPGSDIIPFKQTSILNFTLCIIQRCKSLLNACLWHEFYTCGSKPRYRETWTGSKSVCLLVDDSPPPPVKGLPVVWEKLHKGFMAFRWRHTCLHQASHGVHYRWQSALQDWQKEHIRKGCMIQGHGVRSMARCHSATCWQNLKRTWSLTFKSCSFVTGITVVNVFADGS